MAKIIEAHDTLDSQLPEELRSTANQLETETKPEQTIESGSVIPEPENTEMSTPANTAAPLSTEQVRAMASEEVGKALADQNQKIAVANLVERHLSEANTAKAQASAAEAKVTTLEASNKDLAKQLETVQASLKDANTKLEQAEAAKNDFKKKYEDSDKEAKESKKKLAKATTDTIIENRKKAIASTNLKLDNFQKRAIATNEETGEVVMSDADFEEQMADHKANQPSTTTPTTPAGEAAPATAPATPPAPTQAAASTPPANSTAPVAPDLSGAAGYQQGIAAIAGGTPTVEGVKRYSRLK